MAASEDFDNKILLFNNNGPPESNLCSFEKIFFQNNIVDKEMTCWQSKIFKEIR